MTVEELFARRTELSEKVHAANTTLAELNQRKGVEFIKDLPKKRAALLEVINECVPQLREVKKQITLLTKATAEDHHVLHGPNNAIYRMAMKLLEHMEGHAWPTEDAERMANVLKGRIRRKFNTHGASSEPEDESQEVEF